MNMTILLIVFMVCATVLALAWTKGDVSAGLKLLWISLSIDAKDRRKR